MEQKDFKNCCVCFFDKFAGRPTLYIIDDWSATKELTKKKDMLSQLAFSGRHAEQSVWVISQRYISVLKDLREQAKWVLPAPGAGKAALLFWFFGDFRCGALLFMVIHVIYKYKNK